jgi:hypothetical protein
VAHPPNLRARGLSAAAPLSPAISTPLASARFRLTARRCADDRGLPQGGEAEADKAAIDRREINRRAVKFWPQVRSMLVDMHGRPIGDLARLSPHYDAAQRADGRKRHGAPKLDTFRGPDPCPNADGSGPGAWCDVGTGKSGTDVISLIEYLGECDRKTATEFLKDLTDRLVELTA